MLLGFDGPTGNTYGSIATVDYLLESTGALSVLLVGTGRFVQDLMLWCTAEFGYLRLSDGYVQCSSIMPQKRNPVALEHARALGSKALGQAQGVSIAVHNTPFGDIVDTEDDLQPLVANAFRDAIRAIRLVAGAMSQATFDVERMACARGRRRHDGDRTRRHAGAHARPAVPRQPRGRRALRRRASPRAGAPLVEALASATTAVLGPHAALHRSGAAARAQRRPLHRGAADARWPGARPHDRGAAEAADACWTRIAPGRRRRATGSATARATLRAAVEAL